MEIVRGKVSDDKQANLFLLMQQVRKHSRLSNSEGILFTGYPFLEATSGSHQMDALLVSEEFGIVIFDLSKTQSIEEASEAQDDLYTLLVSKLSRDTSIAKRGRLSFEIKTVSFYPGPKTTPVVDDNLFITEEKDWDSILDKCTGFEDTSTYLKALSIIQAVQRLRPAKRRDKVKLAASFGAKLKKIELQIANLDAHQNRAIIETNPGPQLIRGMAGTGKTVVLAAKAAYLHNVYPDKRIGVTFFSRALYSQFHSLINKFCMDQSGFEADFNRIHVLHAWGARQTDGLYRRVCRENGLQFYDYGSAKEKWDSKYAFKGATETALAELEAKGSAADLFDILLIDEGQDLPFEFFQMAFLSLSGQKKQLVIAFDENQRLNDFEGIPSLEKLLGTDTAGRARYTPDVDPNSPKDDITLEVCYRNPKEILTAAHALELGVYRPKIIDFPMDSLIWEQHGYQITGEIKANRQITISRDPEASPSFFSELLNSEEILQTEKFNDREEMLKKVAQRIHENITKDELEHTDILVILPCPAYELQAKSSTLKHELSLLGIDSHFAGAADPDVYFVENSIAISHIYRAKGNECPMVYLLDVHELTGEFNLLHKRKVLFTALTRAKAFCRVYGIGSKYDEIKNEIEAIKRNNFTFRLKVPLPSEVLSTRHHVESERDKILANLGDFALNEIVGFIDSGLISKDDLPKSFKTRLAQIL